jgi:hypothetical protein
LGITSSKNTLGFTATEPQAAKALAYVVKDITESGKKVSDFYSADQSRQYAADLPQNIAVSADGHDGTNESEGDARHQPSEKKSLTRPARARDTLIPSTC